MNACRRLLMALSACLLLPVLHASAQTLMDPAQQVYEQSLQQAANGEVRAAVSRLSGALALLPEQSPWHRRFQLAALLLAMRTKQQIQVSFDETMAQGVLLNAYVRQHPAPAAASARVAAVLATVFPGAGHLWLHRWRDAGVAAFMVWPMLILTLWAAKRRMGPVTVFFAFITLWLWSGTVFSAISLAERGNAEAYAHWWTGLWEASALPGRPW